MRATRIGTTSVRFLILASLLAAAPLARAEQPAWPAFLEGVYQDARAQGVSDATLVAALSGLQPIARVIELDRRQPEGTVTFQEYMEKRVPAELVAESRRRFDEDEPLLRSIADRYGVDPEYIVALWGLETRFGTYTGGFDVIGALATLAWDERRGAYFREELLHALRILDEGHIGRDAMIGSWAGAMGQSQFMPSSFSSFAVDWDLDGRRDIWTSRGDVFASAANYLARAGWRRGLPWGAPVALPAGFDTGLADSRDTRRLAEWLAMGVAFVGAPPDAGREEPASLVMPGGAAGPAWLVFDNYRTILKWNRSDYFAMSVVTLADAIAGR